MYRFATRLCGEAEAAKDLVQEFFAALIRRQSLVNVAPEKGRFTYRLEEYETGWTERPGNVREALYTKLPPGEYRFQVTACNEDDVWNPAGASLAIHPNTTLSSSHWPLLKPMETNQLLRSVTASMWVMGVLPLATTCTCLLKSTEAKSGSMYGQHLGQGAAQ